MKNKVAKVSLHEHALNDAMRRGAADAVVPLVLLRIMESQPEEGPFVVNLGNAYFRSRVDTQRLADFLLKHRNIVAVFEEDERGGFAEYRVLSSKWPKRIPVGSTFDSKTYHRRFCRD